MDTVKTLLTNQYSFVKDSRQVLFRFCETISPANLTRNSDNIGNGGSIRNLLVHICNSYCGWLSHFALKQPFNKKAYESLTNLGQCAQYFTDVDEIVAAFLDTFGNDPGQTLTGTLANRIINATPLQLFTHVTTHEFHHKGQILALARMWGYTPVDTDILR